MRTMLEDRACGKTSQIVLTATRDAGDDENGRLDVGRDPATFLALD